MPTKVRDAHVERFLPSQSEVGFNREWDAPGGRNKGAGIMQRLEFALTAALIFGVIFGSVRLVERQHRSHAAVSPASSVVAFNR